MSKWFKSHLHEQIWRNWQLFQIWLLLRKNAGVVELADTIDLGSIGRPCRFKSCHPHY